VNGYKLSVYVKKDIYDDLRKWFPTVKDSHLVQMGLKALWDQTVGEYTKRIEAGASFQ
jgi:hypothetical protein